jgi:general L-amino acid transport system substrate-binding protein
LRRLGRLALLAAGVVLATAVAAAALAGGTLDDVRERSELRCGVLRSAPGFSAKGADGRWAGIDVDFCRALAAAVIGDADAVLFVPLEASERFPALLTRRIDLLAAGVTWTLGREVGLGVQFAGVLYHDRQGFLVPRASAPTGLAGLEGATLCLEKGTTHVENAAAYFGERGWSYRPLVLESFGQAGEAFFAGRCQALSGDAAALAGLRAERAGGEAFAILPDTISAEPLGPVVRSGDEAWLRVVRWVLLLLIAAEERAVTQADAAAALGDAAPPGRGSPLHVGKFAAALGVDPRWGERAVAAAGHYGEMFERNLGMGSPLRLERGPNGLWTKGGLMHAPPLR